MGLYGAGENQTGFFFESGAYGNALATLNWIGIVNNHDPAENLNKQFLRYHGTSSRNYGQAVIAAKDFTGTLSFHPQDWKSLVFALGSCVDGGSPSPYTHVISEVDSDKGYFATSGIDNPFASFGLEYAEQYNPTGLNLVRTAKGCMIDTWNMSWDEGGIITVDVNYIAQNVVKTSGAVTALTEDTSDPYLAGQVYAMIESGTKIGVLRGGNFEVNNNLNAPHYATGSLTIGIPRPTERDYTVNFNIDGDTTWTKNFRDTYYHGGSSFNMILGAQAIAGSKELILTMSGCEVADWKAPEGNTGINMQSVVIRPKSVTGLVNDTTFKYNPW